MTIATDITTAATQIASGCATIEAQLDILEKDAASDPQTFYGSGGGTKTAFAPSLMERIRTIHRRMDGLVRGS